MTDKIIQRLLLKRFTLAVSTYLLVIALVWVAILTGCYQAPLSVAWISIALVLLMLVALGITFLSGFNRRFKDPSLTELQVLLALGWQTWLLGQFDSARGTFLIVYVLILLFGLFHLTPKIFTRCALLAFLGFAGVNLWDALNHRLHDPNLAALQTCVLFVVLCWLCLYARFVQSSRHRMHQRRVTLQAHQDTLRGMMFQLEELASTDELTNLYNRRHFLRIATLELEMMDGNYTQGLALIDLDHFKHVNDVYGHAAGDRVLQAFAASAIECLREDDILARYGGEEFVLLIPRCTCAQLFDCCERIRQAFERVQVAGLSELDLSLSVGMTLLETGNDLDKALQRADQALYRAKHNGRNRCSGSWEYADA
ncbi:MAG TPA: diguanylate cyclase [Pseudomonas sp.]|uniref:GGDEF domain-containing protein n=1 Tax=Pseudomonas sp. TaxID=306 RepID=UPI002ED87EDE